MNELVFPEDVANVIQSFMMLNEGDEATINLCFAIGAQILDISDETMYEMIKNM